MQRLILIFLIQQDLTLLVHNQVLAVNIIFSGAGLLCDEKWSRPRSKNLLFLKYNLPIINSKYLASLGNERPSKYAPGMHFSEIDLVMKSPRPY